MFNYTNYETDEQIFVIKLEIHIAYSNSGSHIYSGTAK